MEIKEMYLKDIEARKAEITAEIENDDADLDALINEVRKLNARKSEIEKREKLREGIASGDIGESRHWSAESRRSAKSGHIVLILRNIVLRFLKTFLEKTRK